MALRTPEMVASRSDTRSFARTDSMLCGRIFAIVVNIVTPSICLVAAVAALVVLNPALTGLLLALVAVCAAVLYKVSLGAAASSART